MPTTEYITPDGLKETLSLDDTDFADQDVLSAVKAASRAVDNVCNRRFYPDDDATTVRYYSPDERALLAIDDLATLTTLATDEDGDGTFEQTWAATDYVLAPLNAAADGWPYRQIIVHPNSSKFFPVQWPRTVKLTGKFGWPTIPDGVTEATTVLAVRLLTVKRSAPLGIMAFDGGAVRLARQDQTVMGLLGNYIKHRVAVA